MELVAQWLWTPDVTNSPFLLFLSSRHKSHTILLPPPPPPPWPPPPVLPVLPWLLPLPLLPPLWWVGLDTGTGITSGLTLLVAWAGLNTIFTKADPCGGIAPVIKCGLDMAAGPAGISNDFGQVACPGLLSINCCWCCWCWWCFPPAPVLLILESHRNCHTEPGTPDCFIVRLHI